MGVALLAAGVFVGSIIDEPTAEPSADAPPLLDTPRTGDEGAAEPSADASAPVDPSQLPTVPLAEIIDPGEDASEFFEFDGTLSIADFPADLVPIAFFPLAQVSIFAVRPIPSGETAVAVQRVSSDIPGEADQWRVKFDLWLRNDGPDAVTVTGIEISYPPGGPAPHIDDASPYKDKNKNPITEKTIQPGKVELIRAHDTRTHAFPVPSEATVSLTIDGFVIPFVSTHEMAEYANKTASGGYRFPALAADQPDGTYWFQSGFHADTQTQKYAYDLRAMAWDGKKWAKLKPETDDTKNDSYWIWDTPIYAMAPGIIIGCRWSEPDNDIEKTDADPKAIFSTAGGNAIWVLNDNGDVVEYAHMQQATVPTSLCPVESDGKSLNAVPMRVETGEFLGRVGNSGSSSEPHLHIHIQDGGPKNYGEDGTNFVGFPLLFDHLSLQNFVDFETEIVEFDWRRVPDDQPGALPQTVLISPNECGFNVPPDGIAQVLSAAVTAACWPEVFDTVRLAGYQLDYLEGFNRSRELFFNAIFNPDDGNPWSVHHVTPAEYQALFDQKTGDGFRLEHIDSYLDEGQLFYAVIFEQRDGPLWAAYHGLSDAEHQAEFDRLFDDGYHPVNISVTSVGGFRSYAALYELANVGGFASHSGVPVSHVEATLDAWEQAGLHPVYVKAYEHAGAIFVSMIGEGAGNTTAIEVSIGVAPLRLAHVKHLGEGRRMISVTGYDAFGNEGDYSSVWSEPAQRTPAADTESPAILQVSASPSQIYQGLELCGPTSVKVTAVVSDPSGIGNVTLRYRLVFVGFPSNDPFESLAMTESAGAYSVELAAADLAELPVPGITALPQAVIEFFVVVSDMFGNTSQSLPDATVLVDRC